MKCNGRLLVAIAALTAGASSFGAECEPVVWRQGDFAGKLYRQLAKDGDNLVLSPYGVASVCALISTGARGATADAFAKTLELTTTNPDEVSRLFAKSSQKLAGTVEMSDSVWLFDGFKPCDEFCDRAEKVFHAGVRESAGGAVAMTNVNAYVSERTHGKIPQLLLAPPDPRSTLMMAVNTVYLKAKWRCPFDSSATRDRQFRTLSGESVTVLFMHGKVYCAKYAKSDGFAALALPYRDSDLEMLILLPDENVALSQIETSLSDPFVEDVVRKLESSRDHIEEEVDVAMPKFGMEARHELSEVLRKMGLGIAFSDGADFSGIAPIMPENNLGLGNSVQVVNVRVDEEVTEAVAATSEEMIPACAPPPCHEFVADRPFVFMIRDAASGSLLFIGRIANPAAPSAFGALSSDSSSGAAYRAAAVAATLVCLAGVVRAWRARRRALRST